MPAATKLMMRLISSSLSSSSCSSSSYSSSSSSFNSISSSFSSESYSYSSSSSSFNSISSSFSSSSSISSSQSSSSYSSQEASCCENMSTPTIDNWTIYAYSGMWPDLDSFCADNPGESDTRHIVFGLTELYTLSHDNYIEIGFFGIEEVMDDYVCMAYGGSCELGTPTMNVYVEKYTYPGYEYICDSSADMTPPSATTDEVIASGC